MKMSEPDHGTFFTSHRISGVENLVVPMRNGVCGQKYKPVDYKHLYELAAAEKLASAKIKLKSLAIPLDSCSLWVAFGMKDYAEEYRNYAKRSGESFLV